MILIKENEFGFIELKDKDQEAVIVGNCYRCFGGLILFDRKEEMADTNFCKQGIMVWHVPPSKESVLIEDTEEIVSIIKKYTPYYDAKAMYRCGGNINTKENRYFYYLLKRSLENQIRSLIPGVSVSGVEPTKSTFFSNILFNENRQVFANRYSVRNRCL